MFWIIALIVLGLFLLVVEFFMIPGITIAGIGGFLIIIYSVYSAYTNYGTTAGH
jgi:membrane-bound ClpP family serine protease